MEGLYEQVERHVLQHLEAYFSDLDIDKSIIEDPKNKGLSWIHVTRSWGTHMILFRKLDQYPKEGEKVRYLFREADRWEILRQETVGYVAWMVESGQIKLWLHYDGETLKTVSPNQARRLVQEYYEIMRSLFEREMVPTS